MERELLTGIPVIKVDGTTSTSHAVLGNDKLIGTEIYKIPEKPAKNPDNIHSRP